MNECAICLTENINQEEKCINNCGHIFCKSCIDSWFDQGKNICPLCRQEIQYFENKDEKYRIIYKSPQSPRRTQSLNLHLMQVDRRILNSFKLATLTLSFVIISQLFLVNKLHHYKSELTDSLNSCINNITDLSTIINDNHMINTLDMENTLVLSENDEMRYCSFPIYYLNKCFT